MTISWKNRKMSFGSQTLLCVVAMATLALLGIRNSNNLHYLVLSFLLSMCVLSAFLGERVFRNLRITFLPSQSTAGEEGRDQLQLINMSRIPVIGLTVRVRELNKLTEYGVGVLDGSSNRVLNCPRIHHERGSTSLPEIEVTSDFPFGIVERTLVRKGRGTRLVWPRSFGNKEIPCATDEQSKSLGMVESLSWTEDARRLVWTLSDKGADPVGRKIDREGSGCEKFVFELGHSESSEKFEQRISEMADRIRNAKTSSSRISLEIKNHGSIVGVAEGYTQCLNELALIKRKA